MSSFRTSPGPKTIYTLDKCIKVSKKYKTRVSLCKNYRGVYNAVMRNNWINKCFNHMDYLVERWTKELCAQDAKQYKTKTEWHRKNCAAYMAAKRNGWFDDCTKHMKRKLKYSEEDVLKSASKFSNLKEFRRKNSSKFKFAEYHNFLGKLKKIIKDNKKITNK